MNQLNDAYQETIDNIAYQLVGLTSTELLARPEYGQLETTIGKEKVKIGFWHWQMSDDLHQIVFKANRRVFFFLHKSYINGVVFSALSPARRMTNEEIGLHD
jgi:hypothetical protein